MPSKQAAQPEIGICPSCDTRIRFRRNLFLGQQVKCLECGDVLEVIRLKPVKLDWAFEEPIDDDEVGEFRFENDDDDYGVYDDDDDYDADEEYEEYEVTDADD